MTAEQEAYQAGYAAAAKKVSVKRCPYPESQPELRQQWLEGHEDRKPDECLTGSLNDVLRAKAEMQAEARKRYSETHPNGPPKP